MVGLRPRTSSEWAFAIGALFGLPPTILYFLISGLGLQWYDFFPLAATLIAWGLGAFFWSFLIEKGKIGYMRGAVIGFSTALLTHIVVIVLSIPFAWGALAIMFFSVMIAFYAVPAYAVYGVILIGVRKRYSENE